jgi:hypothetical protein
VALLGFSHPSPKNNKGQKRKNEKIMTIKEILLKHKDGATFGLDFIPITNNAILNWTEKTEEEIKNEIEKIKNLARLLNLRRYYLGWWTIEKTGFLDISLVLKSKRLAIEIGRIFGQKAIYDFSKAETIYL